jgi:hypothetical protein
MRRLFKGFLPIVLASVVIACSMPDGMNDDCQWPSEPASALDVRNAAHQRHLVDDVRIAEELGIRYDDSRLALGPARAGWPRTRDECDTKLFNVIGTTHAVTLSDVRQARERLAARQWDPVVHVPLSAVYGLVAVATARRIRSRFPDEKPAAIVAVLFASVVASAGLVVLGHLWAGAVEMIRVGNDHMSYRAARLGWQEHGALVFALGTVTFWLAALACPGGTTRTSRRQDVMPVGRD